jgi:hypothetical protein
MFPKGIPHGLFLGPGGGSGQQHDRRSCQVSREPVGSPTWSSPRS